MVLYSDTSKDNILLFHYSFYGTYPYILALNLSPSDVSHLFNCSLTVNELQEHVKKQLKFKKDVDVLKKPLEVGFKAVTGTFFKTFGIRSL